MRRQTLHRRASPCWRCCCPARLWPAAATPWSGAAATCRRTSSAVYIQPLENRTQRSQVEQFLTRAIADELVTRQRFAVVGEPPRGRTPSSPARWSASASRRSPSTTAAAPPSTRSRSPPRSPSSASATSEVLWSNDRYIFRESYPVEVSEADYFDREDQAIEEAAERFAETMVSDLLEGF